MRVYPTMRDCRILVATFFLWRDDVLMGLSDKMTLDGRVTVADGRGIVLGGMVMVLYVGRIHPDCVCRDIVATALLGSTLERFCAPCRMVARVTFHFATANGYLVFRVLAICRHEILFVTSACLPSGEGMGTEFGRAYCLSTCSLTASVAFFLLSPFFLVSETDFSMRTSVP